MITRRPQFLITVLLTALLTVVGVYAGQNLQTHNPRTHSHAGSGHLNNLIHAHLDITPEQDKLLASAEARYQQRVTYLEEKLKLSNMELAEAIQEEGQYGPKVEASLSTIQETVGQLQRESIQHLFEMQKVLNPDQKMKLNEVVANALHYQP